MTLSDLQKYLSHRMLNPHPPTDLMVGETVFCTLMTPHILDNFKYMWVIILEKEIVTDTDEVKYKVMVEGEGPIWAEPKFFWTKEQVLKLASKDAKYIPCWEKNLVLPAGIEVRDPKAVIQTVLNLMRDTDVKGCAGYTNLPAVRCNVEGMTLGHFYKIGEALGDDVCNFLNEEKERLKKQ